MAEATCIDGVEPFWGAMDAPYERLELLHGTGEPVF